ncbi:DUF2177 family protein [Rivibacter subsaxonicus]|uniref:Putative membrane protein n=1 Tax=Rivibacter subsaxonicus TaxID=457575 RepID=A0A4Q7VWN3_9BURK|nr:DUF2177 family protein [Rivibacter subsaxonicus]RZU01162.1 putative membrane protein [Rivibacter subsaxonicus]
MTLRLLAGYATALAVLAALDAVWLGWVARDFYREGIGHLMRDSGFRIGPALAFYLLFPLGLMIFAVQPALAEGSLLRAALLGALFGFFCYATYDLSNFATLRDWPLRVTLVDIAWGTLAGALVATAAAWAASRF